MADISVPLTAEAIHNLVRDFPEDAKPKWHDSHTHYYLAFQRKEWYVVPSFGAHISPLHPAHAAALFRDSGLRWLMDVTNPEISHNKYMVDPNFRWRVGAGVRFFHGPTMLHAISAAIFAAINAARKEGER